MRKGQAEFIAVLGVVIIAVIAILLVTNTPSEPQPVSQREKEVRSSLENMIRSGALESLRTLSLQGGYETPPADSVLFLKKEIPYWQKNGVVSVPDTKSTFIQMLRKFINENKDSFVSNLGGDIKVGDASVKASFLDNKIDLDITMPVTLNGDPVPGKFDVEVLTKFGNILKFSEEFSRAQTKDRYLEYNILASMLASPIEDGVHITPFLVALTSCGDFVYRGWGDIKPKVEDRVAVTLAHTYMPEKAPTNVGDSTPYPKYIIPRLNGKAYKDLDISFHLPDDFDLDLTDFQFSPNPIMATATPVAFSGICVSDVIYVKYSMINIPMIVRVKDSGMTDNVFQFALPLFIKDNLPGSWGSSIQDQTLQAQICEDRQCSAEIQVNGLDSSPVNDARVSFMGCSLGKTDSLGNLKVQVTCGVGPLEIVKPGYTLYSDMQSYTELAFKQVTLPKMLDTKVTFYRVSVADFMGDSYKITEIESLPPGKKIMFTMRASDNRIHQRVFESAAGSLQQIPAGISGLVAVLTDESFQQAFGQIELLHTFDESTSELHIYVPHNLQFSQETDISKITEMGFAFTNLLEKCGIGPISIVPVDIKSVKGCTKTKAEVAS